MSSRLLVMMLVAVAACGAEQRNCTEDTDFNTDPFNCGVCGNSCPGESRCIAGQCTLNECEVGVTEDCYTGPDDTLGVGPCVAGTRTCDVTGTWGACSDVRPVAEDCSDQIDNDCNGMTDEDVDTDEDGFTTCGGDCADNTGIVDEPELVNPGAFDAPANGIDDDCDGVVDNTVLLCDQDIASNTQDAMEYARALDICQTTTDDGPRWGVISAAITHADGNGSPDPEGHSIRSVWGDLTLPQGGVNLAVLSTGGAAAKNDVLPSYHDPDAGTFPDVGYEHIPPNTSAFPADFFAANGNKLPNAPGCPVPLGNSAFDPQMLTVRVKVPTNALSFRLSANFYSSEFPEYTCSEFNDFFVVLLDSTFVGTPPNPADKNLAFYQRPASSAQIPVGANLAHGNTGLFTQCRNGRTGCLGDKQGTIATCASTELLTGTGFDDPEAGACDAGSLSGGATGWLSIAGNVTPGEIITVRIGVWDTSDSQFDSTVLIDSWQWSTEVANPGTVTFSNK